MINIDTRLMELVQNKTINTDEFYILLCITKRINMKSQSFPSRATLAKESNFGEKKVTKCITNLVKKGLIVKSQIKRNIANKGNRFSSNLYTVNTNLISVYINAVGYTFTDTEATEPVGQNEPSGNEPSGNDPLSISKSLEVLNNIIEDKKTPNKFDAGIYLSSLNISDELKNSLRGLLEIRKIKKTATTKTVIDLILKNLIKWYGKNIEKQIECINQSVINGWGGVFEMKQSAKTAYQSNLTNEQYYTQNDYNSETTQEAQESISKIVRENPSVYTKKQWNELVVRCEREQKELIFDPGEMKLAKQKWSREK